MFRFKVIRRADSEQDLHISNAFVRMLALESARLGAEVPLTLMLDEQGSSVRERYASMPRLLAPDDELFLVRQGLLESAQRLRREHRSCYFGYVRRLAREIRAARRLRTLAMASKESWSFWVLLAHTMLSESSLVYLRWLGCRHAIGIKVSAGDIKECLDFLLAAPKFDLVMT